MPEAGIAEAPNAAAGVEAVEAPVIDSPEVGQPVEGVESPETPEAEASVVDDKPEIVEDGRAIPVKFKELFKLNPELKDAWFATRAWRGEFPGGLKEAKALKQTFQEIGGAEGLQAIQQEVGDWKALDEQFMAADPRFAEEVANSNPEAFAKLMPAMLDKYGEVAPEEYQRAMAGVLVGTFQQAGVPQALWKLEQCLSMGNTEEAKKIAGEVSKWLGDFEQVAKSQPKPKAQQPIDAREQAIAAREAELFNQAIASDFNAHRKTSINAAIQKYTKGAKVDEGKLEIFTREVTQRISRALDADPKYKEKFGGYYQAKNKDELLKFAKSRFDSLVADAVDKTHALLPLTSGVVKPKPTVDPAKKPVAAPAGWAKIAAPPGKYDIDRSKTSNDMIFDGQAYLNDGRKVYWKDKVPV